MDQGREGKDGVRFGDKKVGNIEERKCLGDDSRGKEGDREGNTKLEERNVEIEEKGKDEERNQEISENSEVGRQEGQDMRLERQTSGEGKRRIVKGMREEEEEGCCSR